MLISLHKNARTTPAIRAEMAASSESAAVLARRFNVTEQTSAKWKKRTSVEDRSHTVLIHFQSWAILGGVHVET